MPVDLRNSRYYCVITQYIAPINTAKMIDKVRELTDNSISKKKYNFRLTSPEVCYWMMHLLKALVA
jgi:hypothetical protein